MGNLTLRSSVVADGQRWPLSQFRKKPRFMGVLAAFLHEVQEVETATVEAVPARYIWNAQGWALEQIGNIVGMPRPAFGPAATDDNVYRVLIYGQIAANVSYGTKPDLYNILRSLQLVDVRIYNNYPASMFVNYRNNSLTLTCGCIRSILEKATHPVQFDITEHDDTPFVFEGDTTGLGYDAGNYGASL